MLIRVVGELEAMTLTIMLQLLCLSALTGLACSQDTGLYYITPELPDYDNCTINGTMLSPCYTPQQLANIEVLASSNQSSVEFLLLPGTYYDFTRHLSDFANGLGGEPVMDISPWNDEIVVIVCEGPTRFHNVIQLQVQSIHFIACELQFGHDSLLTASNCTFSSTA
jgi:hypothetical protein